MHSYKWSGSNGWEYIELPNSHSSHHIVGSLSVGLDNEIYYRGADNLIQKYHFQDGYWYHSWVNESQDVDYKEFLTGNNPIKIGTKSGNQVFFSGVQGKVLTYYKTESYGDLVDLPCGSSNAPTILRRLTNEQSKTNEIFMMDKLFKIYPNPTTDQSITIQKESDLESSFDVYIYNVNGKLLYNAPSDMNVGIEINPKNLQKGINIVKIRYEKRNYFEKVIKL